MFILGLIIGLFLGSLISLFGICLFTISKEEDKQ